ncbi:hypothetical protein LCGC14_2446980, partial [marine sediment metagenome]
VVEAAKEAARIHNHEDAKHHPGAEVYECQGCYVQDALTRLEELEDA